MAVPLFPLYENINGEARMHEHPALKLTDAERAARVTPVDYGYPPGHVFRYGVTGDGTTDDSAAMQAALSIAGFYEIIIPYTSTGYKAEGLVAPDNASIRGIGKPQIFGTTNGREILSVTSKSTFAIRGVRFLGTSATTTPLSGFGAYSADNTGLLTATSCTDVLIEDCEFDRFYNAVTVQDCDRTWIERNRCRRFFFVGILCSATTQFSIERNIVTECQQTGAAVAYGITGTGDEAGGNAQRINSISFNQIDGVPSWDGIMSHDVTGLVVIGNEIRDVRQGIDVGHFTVTNIVNDITIVGNTVQSTATNTWGATPAQSGGIMVAGFSAAARVNNVTVSGNVIREFFTAAGMVGGGNPSNIGIVHADHVTVTGNVVAASGTVISNAGVNIVGTVNSLAVSGNSLQGTMARGGVRFEGVTSDVCAVSGNTILQNTASDAAIAITGSTLSAFNQSGNTSNSTTPLSVGTSTVTYAGPGQKRIVVNQAVASLATGTTRQDTFTVAGVAAGDSVTVTLPGAWPAGLLSTPPIIGTGQVFLQLYNPTGGSLSMAAANFVFDVMPYR